MNARYYDPYLNRFISADTIVPDAKDPQSLNRYAYVRNNPLKYVDPNGHCWGFASGLRNTFYQTTCENIDQAISIIQHPDASVGEKALAVAYVGTEAVAHGTVVVGAGTAAVGCLTGAGTAVCAGAGSAVTAASADGDPTNEVAAVANGVSNTANAIMTDGNPTNEIQSVQTGINTVYEYVENGASRYIGITNNFARRAGEHLSSKGWDIRPLPGLDNLSRFDARAVEQVLIEQNGLANLYNKINSISIRNPIYDEAIIRGLKILEKTGNLPQ